MSNDGSRPTSPPEALTALSWSDTPPVRAGRYWYFHPASFEQPVLVRVESAGAGMHAHFPDMPFPVPLRLLAGGRWAEPLA